MSTAKIYGQDLGLLKRSDLLDALKFEGTAKNLGQYPFVVAYSSGKVSTVTYTTTSGTIVKTLNYTGDMLTSIVLSGDTPSGIALTKTLTYTGDSLTGASYA
jgi:hypothetical protein